MSDPSVGSSTVSDGSTDQPPDESIDDRSLFDHDGSDDGESPQTARRAAIAVGLVVAALIAVLAWGGGNADEAQSPLIGNRVPEVAGIGIDGQPYDIDNHRGQWVVVNFFATWCPPCVAEHPELIAISEWGESRGDVEMVSVVFNEPDPEPVRRFFAERGGDWPVVFGEPSIPIDFQVAQIPETFLIAPSGQVVAHVPGETTAEEIADVIVAFESGSQVGTGGEGE